ncbi:MAG TPA: choice-of-anchor D domain-containing protein [Candidatus Acidoferrum sp.]|nr:choice-of-anchor D domain-containing protein [Candidatus Acidoferrum sp.]
MSANASKSPPPPQTAIQVTPTNLNFGNIVVGKKTSQTASVANTGNIPVSINTASVSTSQFSVSGLTMPISLPVGQSSTFQVWFDPNAAGNATGTLTLQTNNGVSSGQVALTGSATAAPQQIGVSSTSLNLGSATVGTTAKGTLTIANAGGANLILSFISVSGGPFGVSGMTTPSTIAPGGSATLTVSYSPTTAGSDSGSITITSNDPQTPTTIITLTGTGTSTPVAPTITPPPANQTVTAGQTATFTVVATGTAPLSYQWQKNGANIAGASSASYTTPATTTSDSGSTFDVVVSNTVGTVTSAAATLTVNPAPVAPAITTPPANQTVTAGQTATFTVVAGGTAPLSYQWQKNGANIAGASSASYTTAATTMSDSGSTFDVVVSNTVGTVTSAAATLTVNPAPVAPAITTPPANQTVTAGQTATFTVVATGTAPLSYQWQKSGVNIAGASSASYTTAATTTSDSGSTFDVVVSNTAGTVTSAAATLTVNSPPTITTPPANQTVTAGQTATFTVVAGGTAPLSYQWQKNGANIAGASSASYTTPATTTSDSGSTFDVVVSNTVGTVTSAAATLTVNAAPTPGIQVSSTSLNFGNAVVGSTSSQVLIITNTGTATLSITQVTESGSAFTVSGFSLPLNVNAGQQTTIAVAFLPTSVGSASGSISIVSNAPTSPTSVGLSGTGIAATLTLNISPTSLSFGSITTGTSSAPQTVTITNTGNSNVTISQISVSGAGYSITGGGAPVTLSPSQTLTLTALFSPTATGSVSGSISIVSNANGSPASVSLSGTGVAPVQHSVALTWNASTSTVSGYNVYRSTVSGTGYTKLNSSLVSGLAYTDSSVQNGTTYFYVTTAVDSGGKESTYSNEVQAVIP